MKIIAQNVKDRDVKGVNVEDRNIKNVNTDNVYAEDRPL